MATVYQKCTYIIVQKQRARSERRATRELPSSRVPVASPEVRPSHAGFKEVAFDAAALAIDASRKCCWRRRRCERRTSVSKGYASSSSCSKLRLPPSPGLPPSPRANESILPESDRGGRVWAMVKEELEPERIRDEGGGANDNKSARKRAWTLQVCAIFSRPLPSETMFTVLSRPKLGATFAPFAPTSQW